ncbi:acyltransferase family protein [Kitasatospora viridis]|uniref:Peptidoglycan/LPS O-acetylase OafA/YrhL n=1 Tax=Kitasatospora viridis TaxID=281105 RepID=A0A561UEE4_9ACTN|nr:acyltransferase [Kitasatospora viridis]TWF97739.1 peptidoglycan/LPS O-acetylase OafA/YrhL [Kitasatospora viridis]
MSVTTTSPVQPDASRPEPSPGQAAPAAAAAKKPRLYVLDGLRLLAALLVMTWHYAGLELFPQVWDGNPKHKMPKLHEIGQYGWIGVEIFFIISGFVICMSCWGKSVGEFVTSRITRLFPAYWFCMLGTALVLYTTNMSWTKDITKGGYINVLTNLTMMQAGAGEGDVDGVYWTLWVEMRFYILFGLLAIGGLTYRKVLAFCGLWMIGSLLIGSGDSKTLQLIVFPNYAPFFIAGIALYLLYRFGSNLMIWGLIAFSWIMSVRQLDSITGGYTFQVINHFPPFLIITATFLLMIAIALGWFDWMQWKWLTTAGAMTFPFYMIHEENGWVIIHELHKKVNAYVLVVCVVAFMLLLSYLIHRLVERPLAKALGRGLKSALADIRAKSERPARGSHAA